MTEHISYIICYATSAVVVCFIANSLKNGHSYSAHKITKKYRVSRSNSLNALHVYASYLRSFKDKNHEHKRNKIFELFEFESNISVISMLFHWPIFLYIDA